MRRLRQEQPRLGLRKLYTIIQPEQVGRDRFMALATGAGLALRPVRSRRRTTRPVTDRRFPNLIAGRTLNDVNQVWVSDITYYRVADDFYYITLLMDLYCRSILGACVAPTLHAHWSVELLRSALTARGIPIAETIPSELPDTNAINQNRLIHHSDRGSQYLSDAYLHVLRQANVAVSTCTNVYDNAHCERLNGIIKQEYLDCWPISTPAELNAALAKAVRLYNQKRPHTNLGLRTPCAFQEYLADTPLEQHPRMAIWFDPNMTDLTTHQPDHGPVPSTK